MLRRIASGLALVLAASGCGGGGAAARPFVAVPEGPYDRYTCKIAASHDDPLVTEWPAPY